MGGDLPEQPSQPYANGAVSLGSVSYSYDAAGHIVGRGGTLFQSILPSAVSSATYDLANRLTARTVAGVTASPTWDSGGNLTTDGIQTYTWDARNRLSGISGAASFVYDALNRRQSATRAGTTTSFLYDNWDVVQEQQSGSASADLVSGLAVDERFSRGGSTILVDRLGSTVALANGAGISTTYGYDPYGVTQATGTASDNSFQFAGRENDNTGLYSVRNRYYRPDWGRFISEDPSGSAGGPNLYQYAGGSPIDMNDPTGLRETPPNNATPPPPPFPYIPPHWPPIPDWPGPPLPPPDVRPPPPANTPMS